MPRPLALHPISHCGAAIKIVAEAERPTPAQLRLRYVVSGEVGALYVPASADPIRADDLWRRTCFEAFLLPVPGEAYLEINLAPSGRWATYRFDGQRVGMRNALDVAPEPIAVRLTPHTLELSASATLPADLAKAHMWRLGLSAVIEEANGHFSHWALAHASSPEPDFHNLASFVHELSA